MSDADIETRYARLVADPDFERRVVRAARGAMEAMARDVAAEHGARGVQPPPRATEALAHWREETHPLH